MGKFEKEIKILNVDLEETKRKLIEQVKAEYKGIKHQKIYTYDIPCINMRFKEVKELIQKDNELLYKTCLNKLQLVFDEFSDLVDDNILKEIYKELEINNFEELTSISKDKLIKKLENPILNKYIDEFDINQYKWVRLRKNNDKVELTVKHIYKKENSNIQKVKEIEIMVSDFEEANLLLNSLGIYKRNFQEKIRHSFIYKNAEIEIDIWPMLNPYVEIECEDETVMNEIIEKLNVNDKEIVSINTAELYKKIGIDIFLIDTLSFEEKQPI